jgi:hypothetical protein
MLGCCFFAIKKGNGGGAKSGARPIQEKTQ